MGGFFNKSIILYIIKYIDAFSEASHFEKAGECPVASPYMAGVCSYDCSYDAECEDDKKCCRERERDEESRLLILFLFLQMPYPKGLNAQK